MKQKKTSDIKLLSLYSIIPWHLPYNWGKARKNLSQGSRRVPVGTMKTEYIRKKREMCTNVWWEEWRRLNSFCSGYGKVACCCESGTEPSGWEHFALLCGLGWWLVTGVSGQSICPIFKCPICGKNLTGCNERRNQLPSHVTARQSEVRNYAETEACYLAHLQVAWNVRNLLTICQTTILSYLMRNVAKSNKVKWSERSKRSGMRRSEVQYWRGGGTSLYGKGL